MSEESFRKFSHVNRILIASLCVLGYILNVSNVDFTVKAVIYSLNFLIILACLMGEMLLKNLLAIYENPFYKGA